VKTGNNLSDQERLESMKRWRLAFVERATEATQAEERALETLRQIEGTHAPLLRTVKARRDSVEVTRRAMKAANIRNSFIEAKLAMQAAANAELFQKETDAFDEIERHRELWKQAVETKKAQIALLRSHDKRIAELTEREQSRLERERKELAEQLAVANRATQTKTERDWLTEQFERKLAERRRYR
jgi:hypothetical protein